MLKHAKTPPILQKERLRRIGPPASHSFLVIRRLLLVYSASNHFVPEPLSFCLHPLSALNKCLFSRPDSRDRKSSAEMRRLDTVKIQKLEVLYFEYEEKVDASNCDSYRCYGNAGPQKLDDPLFGSRSVKFCACRTPVHSYRWALPPARQAPGKPPAGSEIEQRHLVQLPSQHRQRRYEASGACEAFFGHSPGCTAG